MGDEASRASSFDEARRAQDRRDLQLVETVKTLVAEHLLTYGSVPSTAWLARQIGLIQ